MSISATLADAAKRAGIFLLALILIIAGFFVLSGGQE